VVDILDFLLDVTSATTAFGRATDQQFPGKMTR
jgi:hypothetical protein